jgi:hypothetical protein
MRNSPCYKCKTRTLTCHSECELYVDWQSECAKEKAAKRDYERTENFIVSSKRRIKDAAKKGKY